MNTKNDKAVNTSDSRAQFVPDCYNTQEMRDRADFAYINLFIFLIDIKFMICVRELFLKILLC